MVIVLMGVTGSGKTTVGEQLAQQLGWAYYDADDFHPEANVRKMASGTPLTDEDRWPWLEILSATIGQWLRAEQGAILGCSALKQSYRDILVSWSAGGPACRSSISKAPRHSSPSGSRRGSTATCRPACSTASLQPSKSRATR